MGAAMSGAGLTLVCLPAAAAAALIVDVLWQLQLLLHFVAIVIAACQH